MIRLNDIPLIQQTLEKNRAGPRKLPGTALKNQATGEVVYDQESLRPSRNQLSDRLIILMSHPGNPRGKLAFKKFPQSG